MRGVASRSPSIAGLRAALLIALASVALLLAAPPKQGLAANNTITQPDGGGQYTSIALDVSGFPVISHYDPASGDLKTVHCGNAACSSGNTLASPDTTNDVGKYGSLKLDASGNPVVSYFDESVFDLRLLHCGNANCTAGNTTTSPDSSITTSTGLYSSLALDGSGNPVVSYHEVPHDGLKVLRCNNPTCTSYGSTFADPGNIVGPYTSIALDASGFPVVSYYDETNRDLKVVHCGNATCTSGNTITSPDSAVAVGQYTSIALDTSGNPVVSYYDQSGGDLKVLHCGNPNCTSGNTIMSPDTTGDVGKYSSIRLDGSGHPVVSYYDASGANLRVLHCGDPACASGSVTTTPDSTGDVGQYTSLALDASGNPVVSYYDATNGLLKVLHCGDPACSPPTPTPTPPSPPTPSPVSVGGFTKLPNVAQPGGVTGGAVALILVGTLAVLAAGVAGRLAWRRTRA
jgi:hypothetical protein